MGSRYIELFDTTAEEINQKTAPVGSTNWVRMRGLPFSATKQDVRSFFDGFNLPDTNVFLVVGAGGRPTGEAFVQFDDEYGAQRAILKDREQMGTRYIELFMTTREECDQTIARHSRNDPFGAFGGGMGGFGAMAMYGRGGGAYGAPAAGAGPDTGEYVVRLRGLPFRATEQDVTAFFAGLEVSRVQIAYAGGRPSGEAYVEFKYYSGLEQGLARNRQMLGTRYVEVYKSTRQEAETRLSGGLTGAGVPPQGQGAYGVPAMGGYASPYPAAGGYTY
eukprot:NODE_124_length_2325_cov_954.907293_g101_i0.p2 GENE.NODE_124_length_2325_cov_954.907293_g101_i0~~NODE_124_length_2325_cov_954.907293_g101_i0.p2  ORF type:complete len:276 (-),score=53.08 NODE_124_length_2325_cov_954.907293_g101_i0:107-934(-)